MTIKQISLQLLILLLAACSTVPITGRKQLSLVSSDEVIQMSATQYKEVLTKSKVSDNKEQTKLIKRAGQKIRGAVEKYMASKGLSSELNGFKWEFNLIDNDSIANAWCMPGGKVAFYTGIMRICQDENGVAVVMGHEVAHAIANHGRERLSQGMLANGLLSGLSVAMGENPTLTQQVLLQAMGVGTQLGMLSFSRQDESEADHIGLIFMTLAGYDPNEAPKFWERMVTMNGSQQPPQFLSTHPSHATRIQDLKGWIPEAMQYKKVIAGN